MLLKEVAENQKKLIENVFKIAGNWDLDDEGGYRIPNVPYSVAAENLIDERNIWIAHQTVRDVLGEDDDTESAMKRHRFYYNLEMVRFNKRLSCSRYNMLIYATPEQWYTALVKTVGK